MRLIVCLVVAFALAQTARAQDTDGDELLDLIDVPGFNPRVSGNVEFRASRIQDLDGASLLTNLESLSLGRNQITSIERGDFEGLANLQELFLEINQIATIESGAFEGLAKLGWLELWNNQITTIESGAFEGLANLSQLDLSDNQIATIANGIFRGMANLGYLELSGNQLRELNFTGATFDNLLSVNSDLIANLILDDAALSVGSFRSILNAVSSITDVSLVGLTFSNEKPLDMSDLLGKESLDYVTVDQNLFDSYADEFNAFDAMAGNTVTIATPFVRQPGDANEDGEFNVDDLLLVRLF